MRKFRYWNGKEILKNVGTHPFLMTRHSDDNDNLMENSEEGCMTIFNFDKMLMQYTGLNDINGVEIYEGDVFINKRGIRFVVKYGDFIPQEVGLYFQAQNSEIYSAYGFYAECIDECEPEEKQCFIGKNMKVKVIGNIYENPELLEE